MWEICTDAAHLGLQWTQALVCLELYLYRSGGEQDVWHYFLYSGSAVNYSNQQVAICDGISS